MGVLRFFNGLARLLTTKRGSSVIALERAERLTVHGRLSDKCCGLCTLNIEGNIFPSLPFLLRYKVCYKYYIDKQSQRCAWEGSNIWNHSRLSDGSQHCMRSIGISSFGGPFVLARRWVRTWICRGGRWVIVLQAVHKPNKPATRLTRYCSTFTKDMDTKELKEKLIEEIKIRLQYVLPYDEVL